ncbi:MAG: spore cortex biosynthesis protein YabQ [Bacillota bacterium]|nr:spore cortex biosynthesis protein YabQ [Bacillota bacterium]
MQSDFVLLGATFAAGAGIGLLHDCWQVLLLNTGAAPRRPVSGLRMAGFWLLAVALVWAVLALTVAGMVRGFAFIGLALGAGLYHATLSRPLRRAMAWSRRAVARALSTVLDALVAIVLLPVRALLYIGGVVVSFLTAVLATPGRWLLAGCERLLHLAGSGARLAGRWLRPKPPPTSE